TISETTAVGSYTETITATDSFGVVTYQPVSIVVNPVVTIAGGSNVTTTYGTAKSSSAFTNTGGTGTKTWSVETVTPTNTANTSGFTITTGGVVTVASSTHIDTYSVTIRVTDAVGYIVETTLVVVVNETISITGGDTQLITTRGLAVQSQPFVTDSGTGTKTFSFASGVTGISIGADGVVTVAATTAAGTYNLTIRATDQAGSVITTAIQVVVNREVSVTGPTTLTTTESIARSTTRYTWLYGTGDLVVTLSGTNPAGITIDTSTGILTADSTVPAGTYRETVTATDSLGQIGTALLTITVNEKVALAGVADVTTTFGRAKTTGAFTATLGTGTKTFSIAPTVTGITINSVTGAITVAATVGSASSTTVYYETVTATDGVGYRAETVVVITINPLVVLSGGDTQIVTTRGRAESSSAIVADSGTGTKSFSLVGTAISGITIDSVTGVVTVAKTTAANTYTLTIRATDTTGDIEDTTLSVVVNAEVAIAGPTSISTTYQVPIQTSAFSASLGTGEKVLSMSDTLPAGITFDSTTGIISIDGTVPIDTYVAVITGTDVYGETGTRNITIRVNETVAVTGPALYATTLGMDTTFATPMAATLGTGTKTFSIVSIVNSASTSLDTSSVGITINASTGLFTLTGVAVDTYTVTVRAVDAVGGINETTTQIRVNEAVDLAYGTETLTTTFGRADSTSAFVATLGTGTKIFSIQSITPTDQASQAGISINATTGVVSVLATTIADTYTIVIKATDSVGAIDTIVMTVRVNEAITVTGPATLITTVYVESSTASFTPDFGTGDKTFSLEPGNAGFSIDTTTGVVTYLGTLPAGTYYETVTATDSLGVKGYKPITITINESIAVTGPALYATTLGMDTT
ncbi:MAG: beta strand repeat-containing protein, partial [Candidatus Nanopelagicaceae bacterium]